MSLHFCTASAHWLAVLLLYDFRDLSISLQSLHSSAQQRVGAMTPPRQYDCPRHLWAATRDRPMDAYQLPCRSASPPWLLIVQTTVPSPPTTPWPPTLHRVCGRSTVCGMRHWRSGDWRRAVKQVLSIFYIVSAGHRSTKIDDDDDDDTVCLVSTSHVIKWHR